MPADFQNVLEPGGGDQGRAWRGGVCRHGVGGDRGAVHQGGDLCQWKNQRLAAAIFKSLGQPARGVIRRCRRLDRVGGAALLVQDLQIGEGATDIDGDADGAGDETWRGFPGEVCEGLEQSGLARARSMAMARLEHVHRSRVKVATNLLWHSLRFEQPDPSDDHAKHLSRGAGRRQADARHAFSVRGSRTSRSLIGDTSGCSTMPSSRRSIRCWTCSCCITWPGPAQCANLPLDDQAGPGRPGLLGAGGAWGGLQVGSVHRYPNARATWRSATASIRADSPESRRLRWALKIRRPALSGYRARRAIWRTWLPWSSRSCWRRMRRWKTSTRCWTRRVRRASTWSQWGPADYGLSRGTRRMMFSDEIRPVEELVIGKCLSNTACRPRIEIRRGGAGETLS